MQTMFWNYDSHSLKFAALRRRVLHLRRVRVLSGIKHSKFDSKDQSTILLALHIQLGLCISYPIRGQEKEVKTVGLQIRQKEYVRAH